MAETHVLNGDALLERFPTQIKGEIIVARECLIDGAVRGDTLEEFYQTRAQFISQYPDCSAQEYLTKTVNEFTKICQLSEKDTAFLWFEEDLFCQVNCWFVCYLLTQFASCHDIALVKPNKGNEYSFAAMNDEELHQALNQCISLSTPELKLLADCWRYYQNNDNDALAVQKERLPDKLHFVAKAIDAQLARQPDESGLGYPEKELLRLMKAQVVSGQTLNFAQVFRSFYDNTAHYSFGDLQVKRMFDQLQQDYFE